MPAVGQGGKLSDRGEGVARRPWGRSAHESYVVHHITEDTSTCARRPPTRPRRESVCGPIIRAGVQPGELAAAVGAAAVDPELEPDHLAREAGQDRGEGSDAFQVHRLPAGRSSGAAAAFLVRFADPRQAETARAAVKLPWRGEVLPGALQALIESGKGLPGRRRCTDLGYRRLARKKLSRGGRAETLSG